MIAPDAVQVEHLRPAIPIRSRRQELASRPIVEQGCDDIAARIEVGGYQYELAKSGLTEIVAQHLAVAASERGGRRFDVGGGPAYQVPDDAGEQLARGDRVERRTGQPPPPAAVRPAAG